MSVPSPAMLSLCGENCRPPFGTGARRPMIVRSDGDPPNGPGAQPARGLQVLIARCAVSREPSRGSGGPTNGRASAAAASWPAREPAFAPGTGNSTFRTMFFRCLLTNILLAPPLRAKNDFAPLDTHTTRERGARECRRLRCLERAPSPVQLAPSEIRSTENAHYPKGDVQRQDDMLSQVTTNDIQEGRSGQRSFAQAHAASTCRPN
jgi:hypothetical protein